jgi:hypothetical protein
MYLIGVILGFGFLVLVVSVYNSLKKLVKKKNGSKSKKHNKSGK